MVYEDCKHSRECRFWAGSQAQLVSVSSAYDAARFVLEQWPDTTGPKHLMAREILLKCLEGNCSATVARVAFIEAAREAGIHGSTTPADAVYRQISSEAGKKRPLD